MKFVWPNRPRVRKNRYGDRYRTWSLAGSGLEVVETRSICGVGCGRHFYVGRATGNHTAEILSRHRKRRAAMRAAEQLARGER